MVLGFDRPYARPTSSFNEPVQPPDVDPDSEPTVQVCFSEAWLPYVLGALSQLQLQTTWIGEPDDILLAQGRATNLNGLFVNPICALEETVDAPYWDDETDVDAEEPIPIQPWFGRVTDALNPGELTFIEDMTIWLITGFILASSGGAGLIPAIFFRTNAKEFVLQHRNDNLGDVIRYFVDGTLVAVYTDTGDGTITDVPVVGDPEADDHPIYVTIEKAS